jgi:hypothetical protein
MYDLPAFVDAASAPFTSAYCARLKPVTGLLAYVIAACAVFTLARSDHPTASTSAYRHCIGILPKQQSVLTLDSKIPVYNLPAFVNAASAAFTSAHSDY